MEESSPSEVTPSSSKSPPPPTICAMQKKHSSSSEQDDRSSPEPNCAICLSKLNNKSFTDSCLHQFCFTCLLEWSKVKPQCPLCKQSFKSIIHNVRSEEDYDQYHVTSNQPTPPIEMPLHWEWRPRFRYRTTMTTSYQLDRLQDRERTVHEIIHFVNLHESFIPPARNINTRTFARRRQLATADFRRSVYRNDLWTRPLPDLTGRHRQCTAEFFRMNPAQIHRLVPWLNRELSVLLQIETHMAVVLDIILNLCVRHAIRSDDMRIALFPYLGQNTNHFLHEFYIFASSPYDLIGYDCESQYAPRSEYENQVIERPENADSDNSDIIVLEENPEPSARRSTSTVHIESSDSEVEFVGYVKPRHERTPVLVDLSDEERSQEPVAGPSTQIISDSEAENLPWISDEDDQLLIALNSREDGENSLSLDLTSILSQSSNSYDRDPDYLPSLPSTSTSRVRKNNSPKKLKISKIKNRPVDEVETSDSDQEYLPKSNSKKRSKRKQKRVSRSSSSSSNESRHRENSSSSEQYISPKSYKKSSKYTNPKSSKSTRTNKIESDSSSKPLKRGKKKKTRRSLHSSSENDRPRRKKNNRKRNHSSSWRIKSPKSEIEDEEEKMENRPRLRSIVISKAVLNNNSNNATSSSSYSSSSSSPTLAANHISISKYRITDSSSSE